jgi:membrane protease YdiL (CAAX protease family)
MTGPGAARDGSWERPGRNPLIAVLVGLLVCGGLYSTLGGVVLSIVVAVMTPLRGSWLVTDNFIDLLLSYYRTFQVPILAVTMVMEFLLFFGLVVLLVSRWHAGRPFAYLSYRRAPALDLVLAGLGAVAVVPLAELLDRWSYVILPPLRELSGGEASLLSAAAPWQAALVIAAVALTPAVCEETLFRGWLQGTLRRRLRAVPVIIIQAVLFSLFHLSPLSIVALAFVGMYLGWLFDRVGSIYASMTAHCLYNGTIIALVNIDAPPRWLVSATGTFTLPMLGVSLVVFAAVVLLMETRNRRRGGQPPAAAAEGSAA